MANLIYLLQQYGVLIVFAVVLVEQMGLPIPAYPILIVAGALAMDGGTPFLGVLVVAMSACLLADLFWFRAGRRYGKRILKLLCKISLSPDYCVSQTEDNFKKWGPKSMVVAKFIPGFNTIAPPLAGAMGTRLPAFLGFALTGGLLWSATGIAIGAYFHSDVDAVLDLLSTMGSTALMVLGVLLTLFIVAKYVERRRFQKAMQTERISVDELKELLDEGHDTVGTHVNVAHLGASPIGMSVTFTAEVIRVDGRRVEFRVEARDEKEKIGEGTHERAIINIARFATRLAEKKG